MSATTSYAATSADNSLVSSAQDDLIQSKFNELTKKIFDELKQSNYSREFFQAIDEILKEPSQRRDIRARKQLISKERRLKRQQAKSNNFKELASSSISGNDTTATRSNDQLKKQCELIMERQRQQQEQLDNHQQILFDTQYRSLPAEITNAVTNHEQRRQNAKSAVTKSSVISKEATAQQSITLKELQRSDTNSSGKQTQSGPAAATGKQQTKLSGRLQQPNLASSNRTTNKAAPLTKSKENLSATADRTNPATTTSTSKDQRQRSAIPQSTITCGIGQKSEGFAYPISKSATVGGSVVCSDLANKSNGLGPSTALLGTGLVRQASLRLNKQTREAQQEFIKQQTRPLAASEKLKQRRPTKASIQERPVAAASDDSDLDDLDDDDDEDEDDDDDDYQHQSLASRRAYLDQKFISQQQQQETRPANETKVAPLVHQQPVERLRQQVTSTISSGVKQQQQQQQQAPPKCTTNMTVAKQRQRFSSDNTAQVVRSNTIGGGQTVRPGVRRSTTGRSFQDDEDDDHEQHEPRSLGGLLASHDLSHLYKPHMNYSTSLLGNHRLSDDDEIIIIPTAQSPSSLMSASVSPAGCPRDQPMDEHPDRTTSNIDEFSERFSISRTKSFWEKLAKAKTNGGGGGGGDESKRNPSPQQDRQYFNSSQRSLASGPNLVADSKSSQSSLLNQSSQQQQNQHQHANGNHNHYPAAMKSAFDNQMDSTGGSGNSHYSGCSSSGSTSGDEQTLTGLNLAERRLVLAKAAATKQPAGAPNASMNPTINQLVQQDQLNRSDRFRRTR